MKTHCVFSRADAENIMMLSNEEAQLVELSRQFAVFNLIFCERTFIFHMVSHMVWY